MKILITSDWYKPAVNGVVTSILNLKSGLEQLGHQVKILTLSSTTHSYEENGVIYIGSCPAGKIYPGARIRTAGAGRWFEEIIEWKPDIVHSNCEFSTFQLALRISRELNIPLIHTYHTIYEDYTHYISPVKKWGHDAVRFLSRAVAKRVNALIAPTVKVQNILESYDIETPIYVVPTGIDCNKYKGKVDEEKLNELKAELNIPDGYKVLLYVGRLAKEKNCDELINYMVRLREKKYMLLFVGDGPYREELKQRTVSLGLEDRVIFAGMVKPDMVSMYYKLGDIFVSASVSETQGLTYIEAISSGLPLLCRKDECLSGVLIDGVNGWQYSDGNEFAGRLKEFNDSPELQYKFSENSKLISDKCDISAFAAKACLVYRCEIERSCEEYGFCDS